MATPPVESLKSRYRAKGLFHVLAQFFERFIKVIWDDEASLVLAGLRNAGHRGTWARRFPREHQRNAQLSDGFVVLRDNDRLAGRQSMDQVRQRSLGFLERNGRHI